MPCVRRGREGRVRQVDHLGCARGACAKARGLERDLARERTCGSSSAAPAAPSAGGKRRVHVRWELLAVGETFLPGQAWHGGLCLERRSSLGVYSCLQGCAAGKRKSGGRWNASGCREMDRSLLSARRPCALYQKLAFAATFIGGSLAYCERPASTFF